MVNFSNGTLTDEEAFWVMHYFLSAHYDWSQGQLDITDVLSTTQPFEFNEQGHFDGKVQGDRRVAPADSTMVSMWNDAVKKFREEGKPGPSPLKK